MDILSAPGPLGIFTVAKHIVDACMLLVVPHTAVHISYREAPTYLDLCALQVLHGRCYGPQVQERRLRPTCYGLQQLGVHVPLAEPRPTILQPFVLACPGADAQRGIPWETGQSVSWKTRMWLGYVQKSNTHPVS